MLGNYRVAAQLVAYRVVLRSTELVSYDNYNIKCFWGVKRWPAHKADNITTIYEPIV
jgi:hypothetical protein